MPINRRQTTASKPKFQYRSRSVEDMQKRASQSGKNQDSYISDDAKVFVPKGGDSIVRILPPTWEDPEHFGYEIFVHYGVGADRSDYLCLDWARNTKGECPICAERAKAEAAGEEEYAKSLKPKKRVLCYVIDRAHEDEGPMVWAMPWTIDRDICARAYDKRTKEVFNVDDPDNGFDISFTREGEGLKTKYLGIDIARRPSPISDAPSTQEKLMDFVITNPIPSILIERTAEEISKAFAGHIPETLAEREAGPRRSSSRASKAVYSWDEIHEMKEPALIGLIDSENIASKLGSEAETCSLEVLADLICEALGVESPKDVPAAESEPETVEAGAGASTPSADLRSRLSRFQRGK